MKQERRYFQEARAVSGGSLDYTSLHFEFPDDGLPREKALVQFQREVARFLRWTRGNVRFDDQEILSLVLIVQEDWFVTYLGTPPELILKRYDEGEISSLQDWRNRTLRTGSVGEGLDILCRDPQTTPYATYWYSQEGQIFLWLDYSPGRGRL